MQISQTIWRQRQGEKALSGMRSVIVCEGWGSLPPSFPSQPQQQSSLFCYHRRQIHRRAKVYSGRWVSNSQVEVGLSSRDKGPPLSRLQVLVYRFSSPTHPWCGLGQMERFSLRPSLQAAISEASGTGLFKSTTLGGLLEERALVPWALLTGGLLVVGWSLLWKVLVHLFVYIPQSPVLPLSA